MTSDHDRRYLVYIRDVIALIGARPEATGKLSPALKARHPALRWRAIYGFRNIAAHASLYLCLAEVWEIIEHHLPALQAVVAEELGRSPPAE